MDPFAIESAVAGTAQAAAQQTQQANPIPPTETAAPSATATSTPKLSNAGTSLLTLADGSTQFIDHVAGVQIVFPALWLVFRVGEPEYYAAWEKPETQNPTFLDIFAATQSQDPNVFRVDALDTRPGYAPDGIATTIGVVFQAGDLHSLEEWQKIAKNEHLPCQGYRFLDSNLVQTSNGIRVLVVEKSCMASKQDATLYFRYVFFSLPTGTLHIDFETHFDHKDALLPEFDQVANNVTLLNP
jgi:hypothetical protein